MQKIHTIQHKAPILDTTKGQKIVAALYMVTNHLSDIDPLKGAIRSHALHVVGIDTDPTQTVEYLITLLGAAVLAGIMSEQNVAILTKEMRAYVLNKQNTQRGVFGGLFEDSSEMSFIQKTPAKVSFIRSDTSVIKSNNVSISSDSKNKRQSDILSFINDRKSAAIKDISTLFPDVSEKTIQRELGTLVETGKITKRGSKRWSIYMAI